MKEFFFCLVTPNTLNTLLQNVGMVGKNCEQFRQVWEKNFIKFVIFFVCKIVADWNERMKFLDQIPKALMNKLCDFLHTRKL